MSERHVSIAIDAIGGEQSPYKTLKGSEIFHETHPSTNLILFGNNVVFIGDFTGSCISSTGGPQRSGESIIESCAAAVPRIVPN